MRACGSGWWGGGACICESVADTLDPEKYL